MDDHKPATSNLAISSTSASEAADSQATASWPLYSSKAGDLKGRVLESSAASASVRQPPAAQKPWTLGKNPATGRLNPAQQSFASAQNGQSVLGSVREGQRVRITLATGAEFEGFYANNPADPSSCSLRMVQQKKLPGDIVNGTERQEQTSMSFQRRDITNARPVSGNPAKAESRTPNGNNRTGFRTDTAISNSRLGNERTLKRWVGDTNDEVDGSLEKPANQGAWDQFAANEQLFGLKTDYDENIYTTTIDKNDPRYKERVAAAEKKAREIERSKPVTAHVAEERVMDFAGGNDQEDEEDKYSGVRRQGDFPPLTSRENRYTPPARRAPTGQATVPGAPVDPAIISSQLSSGPQKKQSNPKLDGAKPTTPVTKSPAPPVTPNPEKTAEQDGKAPNKAEAKASEPKSADGGKALDAKAAETKAGEKTATPLRPSAATSRTVSPQVKDGPTAPSATSTVERDVLNSFKTFATQQRLNAEKVRSSKAKADKEVKLIELKKFADSFKLSTPVPTDLISIIAKDPAKQKQIQAKAIQNAEDIAKQKAADAVAAKEKETTPSSAARESQAKPSGSEQAAVPSAPAANDAKGATRPAAPQHPHTPQGGPVRHSGARQAYAPQTYGGQPYRNNRPPPHMAQQNQPTGNLSQRLRNVEQQKLGQGHMPHGHPVQHAGPQDMRPPPTGPANNTDGGFGRRLSGAQHAHLAKLNPHSNEFRPSAFAPAFNPAGPSTSSSPRSTVNNVVEPPLPSPNMAGQLIRRKTKAVDPKKCHILSYLQSIQPPTGRNWDDNDGLKPAFDTQATWRQLQEEVEKPDSTMHMTYKEYFERLPLASAAMATPNPPPVIPQLPHQHQLPFHLQHGAQNIPPRQSPHMPPMQMQAAQPGGPMPPGPFNNPDDHRMMHSSSAQSFASPRLAQVPMAYPPGMGAAPAQMPYSQAVMPQYMATAPQMGQYRSFSNNPQFVAQQPGHMGGPVMMQPPFISGPNAMVGPTPQVPMYPHAHFIQPGNAPPPQAMAGSNGFPSPGRPAATMMVSHGSQQGQPGMYGMTPGVQYQQPMFAPQPGQMGNMRGYGNPGPQQFGTSPQHAHQFGPQHRNGSGGFASKHFQGHNGGQGHQPPQHAIATGAQGRTPDGTEESK